MKALTQALYAKISGSAFATDIGSRFYEDEAPDGTAYLYGVYKIITNGIEQRTFNSEYEDTLIQISIFDEDTDSTNIKDAYEDEKALFDECTLTISGQTFIYMTLENTNVLVEEHTTKNGLQRVRAYHSTYRLTVKV